MFLIGAAFWILLVCRPLRGEQDVDSNIDYAKFDKTVGAVPQTVNTDIYAGHGHGKPEATTPGNCVKIDRSQEWVTQCYTSTFPGQQLLRYNYTRFPNAFDHGSMAVATSVFLASSWKHAVDEKCSDYVKFFLCSSFMPMCSPKEEMSGFDSIKSCRSLCEKVKSDCAAALIRWNVKWPNALRCDQFLEQPEGGRGLCLDPRSQDTKNWGRPNHGPYGNWDRDVDLGPNNEVGRPRIPPAPRVCPKTDTTFLLLNPGNLNDKTSCVLKCTADFMFNRQDKQFAEVWLSVWSIMCFIVTAFTVITFWLDVTRYHYPERPIIFLAMCYCVYSLGHIVRIALKTEHIACATDSNGCSYLIENGLGNSKCVVVFMFLYYFPMASAIWWVILTLSWFLAAGRGWSREAIEAHSSYFHLAAWALPAIQSIAVLITKKVDGDELTGLCFVGNNDPVALMAFVIAPLSLYLALGTFFMVVGFIFLIPRRPTWTMTYNTTSHDRFILRIGIFSLLYFIAASCVIGCYVYAKVSLDQWLPYKQDYCMKEHSNANVGPVPEGMVSTNKDKPNLLVEVFMFRFFMSLIIGTTCGLWVFTTKTLKIWERFICCKIGYKSVKTAEAVPSHHCTHGPCPQLMPSSVMVGQQSSSINTQHGLPLPNSALYSPHALSPSSQHQHHHQQPAMLSRQDLVVHGGAAGKGMFGGSSSGSKMSMTQYNAMNCRPALSYTQAQQNMALQHFGNI